MHALSLPIYCHSGNTTTAAGADVPAASATTTTTAAAAAAAAVAAPPPPPPPFYSSSCIWHLYRYDIFGRHFLKHYGHVVCIYYMDI